MAIKHPSDALHVEREVLTMKEVCKMLGLQKSTAYAAVRKGEIPSIRIGTQIRIPRAAISRMLDGE